MSFTTGRAFRVTVFGESHGALVGAVIDGIPSGFRVDEEKLEFEMKRRSPSGNALATGRKENDSYEIVSGVYDGVFTGAPVCVIIRNKDVHDEDYKDFRGVFRPSHADYAAYVRTDGFYDHRGGGTFSGRLTAPLVFAGALAKQLLEKEGVKIYSHLKRIADVTDTPFESVKPDTTLYDSLSAEYLPVIDKTVAEKMRERIFDARLQKNSVGGIVETMICGLSAGLGEPFFDSVESVLSSLLFSVPAIKGVEFGDGFGIAGLTALTANDGLQYENGIVTHTSNHNGGITGGLTNGMPVIFRAAVKPTPSVASEQKTVDINEKKNTVVSVKGRHDPCIAPRALVAIEACAAIGIYDIYRCAKC